MKKRLIGTLLLGAFLVSSSSVFVSCKDYDDDIADLQKQIDANKANIEALQAVIQNGGFIKQVNSITNGIEVVTNDGHTYPITNGKDGADGKDGVNGTNGTDGKDGTVWTINDAGYWVQDGVATTYRAVPLIAISEDGYWVINGEKTTVSAKGEKGEAGTPGTPGAPGESGSVSGVQIEIKDGVWYVDGKSTGVKAQGETGAQGPQGPQGEKGEAGQNGTNGTNGKDGQYYVPNGNGTFDIYQDGVKVSETTIKYWKDGTVTATKTADELKLYGVNGDYTNAVTISLNGTLKSLVFVPKLYLDGIEAIQYKWIGDTIRKLIHQGEFANLGHHGTTTGVLQTITPELDDWVPNTLGRYYDAATNTIMQHDMSLPLYQRPTKDQEVEELKVSETPDWEWVYGPVWPVDYHLNPATSSVTYANAPHFNVLEPDVVYYNVRAAAATLGVSSPEKYYAYNKDGEAIPNVFQNKDGILTVGIQIEHPDKLAPWPTDETINPNGNVNSTYSYPAYEEDNTYGHNAYGTSSTEGYDEVDAFNESWYGFAKYKYSTGNKDNTVALQITNEDGGSNTITSDYALIVPTRVALEGLVWAQQPEYIEPTFKVDQAIAGRTYAIDGVNYYNYGPNRPDNPNDERFGDEEGWAIDEYTNCTTNRIHIWDTPEEAIADPDGAALELPCFGAGIDLKPYIGLHALVENLKKKELSSANTRNPYNFDIVTLKYGEEKFYGLHYEFQLVDYVSSTNGSHDSRYATFTDWTDTETRTATNGATYTTVKDWNVNSSYNGVIKAQNVTPVLVDGSVATAIDQSESAVDREPLVRVLLKNDADQVLLDGYILLHIYYIPDNIVCNLYPEYARDFDLCNPITVQTTWNEFSRYVLTETLNNMQILAFHDLYWADCMQDPTKTAVIREDEQYVLPYSYLVDDPGVRDGHQRGYQLKIFNLGDDIYGNNAIDPTAGGSYEDKYETENEFEDKALGDAVFYPNGEGTTNQAFKWTLSEEEVEYLTHDKNTEGPITVTRWIRFVAKDIIRGRLVNNTHVTYPYVWIKMTMKITRKNKTEVYKEKNTNYWYHYNPQGTLSTVASGDGWSAILLDIQAPRNGVTIKGEDWNSPTSNTLVKNFVNIEGLSKYYFAPKNPIVITAQNGRKYTITPRNDNYVEPFVFNPVDSYLAITTGTTISMPAGFVAKDFQNTDFYDKLFCKYVWPHQYVNLNEPEATTVPPYAYLPNTANIAGTLDIVELNPDGNGKKKFVKNPDNHTWAEATLENTLKWCAILYENEDYDIADETGTTTTYTRNAGVFNDSILYAAYNDGTNVIYTPIAQITQQEQDYADASTYHDAGNIKLIHWLPIGSTYQDYLDGNAIENKACYDVLNAIGYPIKEDGSCDFDNAYKFTTAASEHNNYQLPDVKNYQLHAWLGVVAKNDCNVAKYVQQEKYDDQNIATFVASWQRPINLATLPIKDAIDANTNENWIYLIDYLKLYDWRGDKTKQGYMYDDHFWFWGYYNIHRIDIDLRPSSVRTTMHNKNLQATITPAAAQSWPLLSDITTQAILRVIQPDNTIGGATLQVYNFDLTPYASADQNAALISFMGLDPVNNANKARFGGLYYANNGDNVTDFYLSIPITIYYEWGYFKTNVIWYVGETHGREGEN